MLKKEVIRLYGLAGKKDLEYTFQDMTLSIKYDRNYEETKDKKETDPAFLKDNVLKEIEVDNEKVKKEVKAKPKKKVGRPRKKRK